MDSRGSTMGSVLLLSGVLQALHSFSVPMKCVQYVPRNMHQWHLYMMEKYRYSLIHLFLLHVVGDETKSIKLSKAIGSGE